MANTRQTMTDEQRKSVAIEYLKAFDRAGATLEGGASWTCSPTTPRSTFQSGALPPGRTRSASCSPTSAARSRAIEHHYSLFKLVFSGGDVIVVEGTSHGEHRDGPWRAGVPEWGAGRWCDVFEIRDFKIQRCFIYLDPDYAGRDTERYPWLTDRRQ